MRSFLVRRRALLSLGVAMTALATQAAAQQAPDAPAVETTDLVVTGSRIQRDANATAPSPITTVTAADVRQTGQVDATEALREIPDS